MKPPRFALAVVSAALIAPALPAQQLPRLVVQGVPKLLVHIVPDKNIPVYVGMNPTPVSGPVRPHVPATEGEVVRLDNAFERDWTKFDLVLGQLGKLNNADRVANSEQAWRTFYRNYGRTANGIVPPRDRDRFVQLGLPSVNYNAFSDPSVIQGLGLSNQQREQFIRLSQEYDLRMNQINQRLGTVPWNVNEQLGDFRRTMDIQVNAILNGRQRAQWQTMRHW